MNYIARRLVVSCCARHSRTVAVCRVKLSSSKRNVKGQAGLAAVRLNVSCYNVSEYLDELLRSEFFLEYSQVCYVTIARTLCGLKWCCAGWRRVGVTLLCCVTVPSTRFSRLDRSTCGREESWSVDRHAPCARCTVNQVEWSVYIVWLEY